MSRDRAKLPALPKAQKYEVGYGKPPGSSRFKPGQSGNPKGRPRGAKNKRPALNEEGLESIIIDEAYREITVRDGDRNVSVPMAQAVVRALAVNAAKGQHRAQRLFAEMLSATERQNKALNDAWLETAIEYKIGWDLELERRRRLGITHLPDPLPHPDQVIIDMNAGTAHVQGPMTPEQQRELGCWKDRRRCWIEELEYAKKELATEDDPGTRKIREEAAARTAELIALIDGVLEKIGC